MRKLLKPLMANDLIRIVAPASPFDRQAFLSGIKILSSWSFETQYQKDIFSRKPYLAGTDKRRANELFDAFKDDNCSAILFARGGYGSMRLLPELDKIRFTPKPKLLIGYSDITSLLLYVNKRWRWPVFYGPVIAKDIAPTTPAKTLASFKNTLTGSFQFSHSLKSCKILRHGQGHGQFSGGCLTLVSHLMGTTYEPSFRNHILFLEDINEKPYQIDRMLTHLKLCGAFDSCKGLVIGSMNGPNPIKHYNEAILDVLASFKFPIVSGFNAGHSNIKITLPLGVAATLNTRTLKLEFPHSPFQS